MATERDPAREDADPAREDTDPATRETTQGIPVDRTQGLQLPDRAPDEESRGTWTGRAPWHRAEPDPWGESRPRRTRARTQDTDTDTDRDADPHRDDDAARPAAAAPAAAPLATDRPADDVPWWAPPTTAPQEPWIAGPADNAVSSQAPPPGSSPWSQPSRGAGRGGRSRRTGTGVVAAALLLGLLGGVGGAFAVDRWLGPEPEDVGRVVSEPQAQPEPVPAGTEVVEPSAISTIARDSLPGVVLVRVGEAGLGSGFVLREDGYIVTNNHVIAESAQDDGPGIEVQFADQSLAEAELVGRDVSYDLAVLRVDRDDLPALPLGDSAGLEVGAGVVAVGAPLGLESTVTAGIVSALDRPVTAGQGGEASFINAVQTDAAINPGNSGGPLLDMAGRVVGVNSAIAQLPSVASADVAGSIGLGFAIPVDQVERTANELIETGTSSYPVAGVSVDMQYTGPGARVVEEGTADEPVVAGGPADEAGILPGEIILSVDGRLVNGGPELIVQIRSFEVGDTVSLVVQDADGGERTVEVTLEGTSS